MKHINKKAQKVSLEEYKKTLILLSVLLAVMSLLIFMPLKQQKQADTSVANYSK